MVNRLLLAGLAGLAFLSVTPLAFAQQAPAIIRGKIEKVDGKIISIKAAKDVLTVKLADKPAINAAIKIAMADIKPGAYVGATSFPQPDGSWRATEVHVFPEAMRGTGEGDHEIDAKKKNTMTNATLANLVEKADGRTITLKFKNGEKTILVPADALLFTYVPGNMADLKPGATIIIRGAKKLPDGSLEGGRITVGRDLVLP